MKDKHHQGTQELPLDIPDMDVPTEEYDENCMVIKGITR